ncbi:MAG: hypothetical protein DME25_16845 [Verrucomicrobia bacterium]|nr:MAG: hypothetical protein DME25_16845 [Verrucomicrobiota bacterium]
MVNLSFNRLIGIGVLLAATVVLPGCGRKENKPGASTQTAGNAANEPTTSPAANPVDPAASPSEQEKARVAQAVAMREGKAPPPPAITLRGGESATADVMKAYNQQLAQLIFQRRDAPETLDELVRKWPMPKLPTPPPGKQILYDARYRIIVLYPP